MATLSYVYANSVVVLDDLAAESHPMVHDMCNMHASNVRVPMGWTLHDMRTAADESRLAADTHGARSGSEGASPLRLVGA